MTLKPSKTELSKWEKLLEGEGLGLLPEEKLDKPVKKSLGNYNKRILQISDISKIEIEQKVKLDINGDLREIYMYDTKGGLIGYIKPGHYTYGKVDWSNHLEKKVFDDFRGKGLGQLLFDVYSGMGFNVPKIDVTHKPSTLQFLIRNGYQLIGKYDENGFELEVTEGEIYILEDSLKELISLGDEDLPNVYKLSKKN